MLLPVIITENSSMTRSPAVANGAFLCRGGARCANYVMQRDVNWRGRMRGRPPKRIHGKTLAELGITRQQAHQWRRLAEIPEDVFEMLLRELPRLNPGALIREWNMMNQRHH